MAQPVDDLLDLLDLERIEVNLFRGRNPADRRNGRVFGGQVASQALRAAAATVEVDHHPHSLHGYFLRPGEPATPIVFSVDRPRDGRSFTTRRVVAVQHGEAIFALEASFHRREEGDEYHGLALPEGVPDPDAAAASLEVATTRHGVSIPFEVVELGPGEPDERGRRASARRLWVRTRGRLPDDDDLHACVLAYVSDMGVVAAGRVALGLRGRETVGASLDHALWFHRPLRADDWVLFDVRPVSASNARMLLHGSIHGRDGTHAVSIAQEAVIRRRRSP